MRNGEKARSSFENWKRIPKGSPSPVETRRRHRSESRPISPVGDQLGLCRLAVHESLTAPAVQSKGRHNREVGTIGDPCSPPMWPATIGRHAQHRRSGAHTAEIKTDALTGGRGCYVMVVAQDRMKSRRSALIVSACVVGMPCGKPWYVFSVPFGRSFA